MDKLKKLKTYFAIFLIAFIFTSCEKYAEGGAVKKSDKRIIGAWTFSSYLRNGTNETDLVYISNLKETYTDGGVYSRSYNLLDGTPFSEDGSWSFASDNLSVNISNVSSLGEFSAANSTLSASSYTIKKLTKDEYWYTFDNGGDTHEFHFVK